MPVDFADHGTPDVDREFGRSSHNRHGLERQPAAFDFEHVTQASAAGQSS
jgi:hypothetical protein